MTRASAGLLILAGISTLAGVSSAAARDLPLDEISLPDGFRIEVFTDDVPGARSMVLGPGGTLFVGTRKTGDVYAVPTTLGDDGAREAQKRITIASGLDMPNGVAMRDGSLYVAEQTQVWRFDDIESSLDQPPEPVAVGEPFPEGHHGWKYIAFGPDDRLYVPIGVPCNVCDTPGYGLITRMDADGTNREVFAKGVRNTVGFAWHPDTDEFWFTDNGRDWMGDDIPPCELNHAPAPGMHFGFPHCHGTSVSDPEYGEDTSCGEFVAPVQDLGPHVAPLGMKFYTGEAFPADYRKQAFIAEHGSWNRSVPIGYRVTLVRLDGNKALSYETFAEGWLREDGKAWGRPVDLLVLEDGSMLVSDDEAGVIYRIVYEGTAST